MPESTCLHIQDQESGPIRVVDIPWISVRIGRAAFCEVRLTADGLADEACRLYRRGRTWHLVPVGARGKIVVDGRTVDAACPLPFGVPFRVGSHCLTLRQDRTVDPDWQMYPGRPAAAGKRRQPPSKSVRRELAESARPASVVESQRVVEASFRSDQRAQAVSNEKRPSRETPASVSVRDRWQDRWRAAGAELKARDERRKAASESLRSGFGAGFESVPLKEAAVPRFRPRHTATPREGLVPEEISFPRAQPSDAPANVRVTLVPEEVSVDLAQPEDAPTTENVPVDRARDAGTPASSAPPSDSFIAPEAPFPSVWASEEPIAERSPIPNVAQPDQPVAPEEARALIEALSSAIAAELEAVAGKCVPEIVDQCVPEPAPQIQREALAEDPSEPTLADCQTELEAHSQPEAAAVEPESLFDEIEPVPADYLRESATRAATDDFNAETAALTEDASWYEIPVLAPAPPKRRHHPQSHSRKRAVRSLDPPEATNGAAKSNTTNRDRSVDSQGRDRWARAAEEPEPSGAPSADREPTPKPAQMPSAKDILATHESRRRAAASTPSKNRQLKAPSPTAAREPDQWAPSIWLTGPPAVAIVLALGISGIFLSVRWASDARAVALVSERLIAADQSGRRTPLPEGVTPPTGSWTSSTAQHLAQWAVYISFPEPGIDPSPEDIAELSSRAIAISPLNPTARLALAQLEPLASDKAISPRAVGLSRDAASLCWSARRLLAAGIKEAALNTYVRALKVLVPAEPFRAATPRFCDDQSATRYLLPGEEQKREILREMLSKTEWEFSEWSAALPGDAATLMAAARLFKEQGKPEAEALIDRLADIRLPIESGASGSALALAARAEACALRSQWKESEQNYRLAIDLVDDDRIKRSWWFNLADIELRLNDETQWQSALRAALAIAPADEISRRATEVQRANSGRTVARATRGRAF